MTHKVSRDQLHTNRLRLPRIMIYISVNHPNLDRIFPTGLNVIISGLADDRVMWDMLGERTHPLGEYRNDATYPDFYKYLDCLQVSPCAGWMSADPEIRNMTSERAANLSAVYEDIGKRFNKMTLFHHILHIICCIWYVTYDM